MDYANLVHAYIFDGPVEHTAASIASNFSLQEKKKIARISDGADLFAFSHQRSRALVVFPAYSNRMRTHYVCPDPTKGVRLRTG